MKKLNFPVEEISTMVSIAIRFVPIFVSETQKIIFAQKSRAADVESKNLKKRAKFIVAVLVPLLVSSLQKGRWFSGCNGV